MLQAIKRWRRSRILARHALPDEFWRGALQALPFVQRYSDAELIRLRELVVLFLHAKSIVGAKDFNVTPFMRAVIALQACVLILNLDLDYYQGWEGVVVYPGEFLVELEHQDEAGVIHKAREPIAGEAWERGPVILSWQDVRPSSTMNVVIHEFAHKLDMLNGAADGFPLLHAEMSRQRWADVFTRAYEDFCRRLENGEDIFLDAYAAQHPAEFFAVTSEIFFIAPDELMRSYPEVYGELSRYYRQDPLVTT